MQRRCMDCKAFYGEKPPLEDKSVTDGLCPVCFAARMAEEKALSNERVKQIEDAAGSAAQHFAKAFNSVAHGLTSFVRFWCQTFRVLFLVAAEGLAQFDTWLEHPRWPDVRRELKGAVMYDGETGRAL